MAGQRLGSPCRVEWSARMQCGYLGKVSRIFGFPNGLVCVYVYVCVENRGCHCVSMRVLCRTTAAGVMDDTARGGTYDLDNVVVDRNEAGHLVATFTRLLVRSVLVSMRVRLRAAIAATGDW